MVSCHQITREGGEVDEGKVTIYPIHSMFAMVDMVKLASPIIAVFSKKSIKSLVECHPGTFVLWPSQHLLELIAIVVGSLVQRFWISEMRD